MNWQNSEIFSDEENNSTQSKDISSISIQNEHKMKSQLQSLQDPKKDKDIQKYISLMNQLGDLIVAANDKEERVKELLTEDCQIFLFNFAEITPVRYTSKHEGFIELYKQFQIIERDVKEVYFGKEKLTGFQICHCKILINKMTVEQFSFEVISFQGEKIAKYRASFGICPSLQNPFEPSRKDRMLAKVKELNYAWADQPDLEKIASLLHESTEYKIWIWEGQKGFTFGKHDIAIKFKSIEENYVIKCVVPYEVYSEGTYIIATYVYHLEKNSEPGRKYIWLSTCIYTFDKDVNIAKINQQGELHLENETLIPFTGSSRDERVKHIKNLAELDDPQQTDPGVIDNAKFHFSFEVSSFGPSFAPTIGTIKGFNEYQRLMQVFNAKHRHFEWMKPIDSYIDCCDPSYDVAISIYCGKGFVIQEGYEYSGIVMNYYSVRKVSFENGKIAKFITFFSEIRDEIPTPYDDLDFSSIKIKSKKG